MGFKGGGGGGGGGMARCDEQRKRAPGQIEENVLNRPADLEVYISVNADLRSAVAACRALSLIVQECLRQPSASQRFCSTCGTPSTDLGHVLDERNKELDVRQEIDDIEPLDPWCGVDRSSECDGDEHD